MKEIGECRLENFHPHAKVVYIYYILIFQHLGNYTFYKKFFSRHAFIMSLNINLFCSTVFQIMAVDDMTVRLQFSTFSKNSCAFSPIFFSAKRVTLGRHSSAGSALGCSFEIAGSKLQWVRD